MNEIELNGTWKATPAAQSGSDFSATNHDDSAWTSIEVPSHWASEPALAGADGPVLYRRQFQGPSGGVQRSWIRFGGVFTHASVWVDGSYVGDLDGYFAARSFEITNAISAGQDHVVALEVNAPSFDMPWAAPGGIWQPVTVHQTGVVRIARMKVVCSEARDERAVLTCSVELDSLENIDVQVNTIVRPAKNTRHAGADHHRSHKIAAGANRLHWHVTVERPDLWWPWRLGNQPFFDVSIEVIDLRSPDQVSDQDSVRTGLRQVSFEKGFTFVNGERLFLKSIESGNDGTPPTETDRDYFVDMIEKRKDVGANLLVRSRWIEPSGFYDVADELGMLVWQGLPSSSEKAAGPRHARQMVEVLGHHPSIALWLRPMKRWSDRRPAADPLKRTLDQSDSSRTSIEHPAGWDLSRLTQRDVLAIVPKWARRSRFLYFTSDPREAVNHIDALRLLKYRPLGGFIAPRALPEMLDGAAENVRLLAIPKERLTLGQEAEIDVFVVNDSRSPLVDATISAHVADRDWRWTGNVEADSASYVGTAEYQVETDKDLEMALSLDGEYSRTVVFH